MSVCLRHVKTIVRNRFCFSWISPLYTVVKGQTCPVYDSPIHSKHDGEDFSSVCQSVCKLHVVVNGIPIAKLQISS